MATTSFKTTQVHNITVPHIRVMHIAGPTGAHNGPIGLLTDSSGRMILVTGAPLRTYQGENLGSGFSSITGDANGTFLAYEPTAFT